VRRPGLAEVGVVWTLLGLVALATVVTYARLPPEQLYHVSESGIAGGLGRALVFVNFPVAIAAIATLPVVVDRLRGGAIVVASATAAAALCAVVVIPGVVDQADLDAKAVNAVPAVGVAIAVGLFVPALARGGLRARRPFERADWLRLGLAALLVVAAIPWICAELGFYASDLPVVGRLFLAEQVRPNPGGAEQTLHAVHLGRHHGMDGTLLALTGLALSRVVPDIAGRAGRRLLALAVSALFVYGVLNAAQDDWFEQVVKRGWTDAALPSFLRPGLNAAWAFLLAAAAVVYAVVGRRLARDQLRHDA
jgi:uncharacterized membrane protein